MARFQALCVGLLGVAFLAPSAAWSQEAPAAKGIADALTTITSVAAIPAGDVNAVRRLGDARRLLVEQHQQTLPQVAALLKSNDGLVRINAAIILNEIAKAGDTSPAVVQALQQALNDKKEPVVAYWGFLGLMNDGVPAAAARAAMKDALDVQRPRALRLAALAMINEKKPAGAVPLLVDHLQALMNDYKAAVETLVPEKEEAIRRPGARQPIAPPAPVHGPVAPTTPPPPVSVPPGVPTRPPDFHAPLPPPAEGDRPPAPAAGTVVPVLRKNVDKLPLEEHLALVQAVDALPAVAEFHQTGLIAEEVISNLHPDRPAPINPSFKATAPWDLNLCAENAVGWLNKNRAEYEPVAPRPPPPPVTRPAPATTASAPAGTASAPASTAARP